MPRLMMIESKRFMWRAESIRRKRRAKSEKRQAAPYTHIPRLRAREAAVTGVHIMPQSVHPSRTIGITLGDAAGIGPEIVAAALSSGKLDPRFAYRVIGTSKGVRGGRPDARS